MSKKKKQYTGITVKKIKNSGEPPTYEVYGSLCNRVSPVDPLGIIQWRDGRYLFSSGPSVMLDTITLRELSRCVGDLQSAQLDIVGKELRRQFKGTGKLKL